MLIKSFILLLLLLIVTTSTARAQYCGGSYLNLELKFEKKVKTPVKVSYELFYVLPKLKSVYEIGDQNTIEFVSRFYYGDSQKAKYYFWQLHHSNHKFLKVQAKIATKYIKNYKLEDFEVVLRAFYRERHFKQLKGTFEFDRLTLETGETDNTPFLMRVSAHGFQTLYFLSDFLGGCHNSGNKHLVLMKKID